MALRVVSPLAIALERLGREGLGLAEVGRETASVLDRYGLSTVAAELAARERAEASRGEDA